MDSNPLSLTDFKKPTPVRVKLHFERIVQFFGTFFFVEMQIVKICIRIYMSNGESNDVHIMQELDIEIFYLTVKTYKGVHCSVMEHSMTSLGSQNPIKKNKAKLSSFLQFENEMAS